MKFRLDHDVNRAERGLECRTLQIPAADMPSKSYFFANTRVHVFHACATEGKVVEEKLPSHSIQVNDRDTLVTHPSIEI